MAETLLSLENITMKFGGVTALGEVNLEVKKGEILALIGPNGAGKTTVFNVVTGVYKPTSGTITFAGTVINKQKRFEITQMGIARTFQNIRLWGDMTTLENVITATDAHKKSGLVGALFGMPRARREERENRERALEILKFIGIDEYADRLAKNLPYGVQRRLEIARAMGTNPQLLLLDEPAAHLDAQARIALFEELVKWTKEENKLVILCSHELHLNKQFASRTIQF
jgi:branched-chain amino acid transport system ATP-binding protein